MPDFLGLHRPLRVLGLWVEGLRLQGFEWFWGVYGGSVYTESAMKSCGTESCGRFKASKKQQQELCWFIIVQIPLPGHSRN